MRSPSFLGTSFIGALLRSLLVSLSMLGLAHAGDDRGTAAEAEAMVKRAVAYLKANGSEKAYDEFTKGKTFKDRDLFIIVYDLNGKCLAQGFNPKLIGKDLLGMKDPDGKLPIQMMVDLAKEQGKGWVTGYKFMNPVSQKMEEKALYLERVGDVFVGSGIHKG